MFGHRVLVRTRWASDGYWDWTQNNGDKHFDVAALRIVKRFGEPRLLVATLGPIWFGVAVGRSG